MSEETPADDGAPRDRALFERLVREHSTGLYRLAYWLCGGAAQAEDLVQETYLEGWRVLPSLRDADRAKPWLQTILRRRHARSVRLLVRLRLTSLDRMDEEAHGLEDPGADVTARLEDRDALSGALAAVPAPFREALLLVYSEGLSVEETAARLRVARGTVLSRIHRARHALRAWLRQTERREEGGLR